MKTNIELGPKNSESLTDIGQYLRLICKLIYLTVMRHDITFSVSIVNQLMHILRTSHLDVIDKILRYLKPRSRNFNEEKLS
jgi:hypothetical protein